jgi:2-polyprenyl-3-methyl-5-hydroxy-6-metoxy-1,4-benzoquinol methylase
LGWRNSPSLSIFGAVFNEEHASKAGAKGRYDFPDAARALLREIPEYRKLSFLELGCGDGHLLEEMAAEGATVRGTTYRKREQDYIRSRDYPKTVQVDEGIDLNHPLPYPDASFDVVYSTEVIEHLESHRTFISESARVLRPGGWLVMTTPNLHRLLSRIHFAISGVHLTKCPGLQTTQPLDRMEETHHHCVDFVVLHWLLWQCGFRIESMIPGFVHPISRLLMLFAPIVRRCVQPALQRYYPRGEKLDDARKDLVKWMNSTVLLTTENLCFRARKTGIPLLTAPL